MKHGNFVVVKYNLLAVSCKNDINFCLYVGQVFVVFANKFQAKFLQPFRSSKVIFHFPVIDDLDYVNIVNSLYSAKSL